MIKNSEFLQVCFQHLKQIQPNESLCFQTSKKDRSVEIIKVSQDCFCVKESGFLHQEFNHIDAKELKKLLKDLQKREFPRSNQLWFKTIKKTN